MKRILITLIATLAATLGSSAQILPSLLFSSDASALGVAGVSVSAKATAFAVENNAAAISFSDKSFSAGVSYGLWFPTLGSRHLPNVSAWWHPDGRFAVGLSASLLLFPAYDITNENGVVSQVNGTFSPKETCFRIGGSFRMTDYLSIGLTATATNSVLGAEAKAMAFGIDVSLFYDQGPLQAGLVAGHLGPAVRYAQDASYRMPMVFRAGAAYRIVESVKIQAEADWFPAGNFGGGAGASYCWNQILTARTGFHMESGPWGKTSYGTLGLGASAHGLSLDVAWIYFGQNHRNTLQISFGYAF